MHSFVFNKWDEDVGICDEFTYWLQTDNGMPVPSFIRLFNATRTITVISSDYSKRGYYNLTVRGQSANYP